MADNIYEGLGERLRSLRKQAHLKQDEMGVILGVSRQTVNAYERERQMLTAPMVANISQYFKIQPWWLLFGIDQIHEAVGRTQLPTNQPTGQALDLSKLSEAQRFLIKYIAEEESVADNMARLLFKKAMDI